MNQASTDRSTETSSDKWYPLLWNG